jgi:diguanylate cyclase (GGDEF)-like protein
MDLDNPRRIPLSFSVAPFAAAAVLAWLSILVGSTIDWGLYSIATGLLVLSAALVTLRGSGVSKSRFLGTIASLIFLASVALLRNSAGGSNSGVAVLSLIPVFYTAMYSGSDRQLYVVLAGMTIFYLAPILIVGPPAYPHTQYRAALLTVAVSSIIGLATRHLVANVRHEAGEALSRERMLAQVHEVMRDLVSSPQARIDVCDAAMTIGEASMAVLFEPVRGSHLLMRSTAAAGVDAPPVEISMLRSSAVSEAFASGEAILIDEDVEAHVGSVELWTAAGKPPSVLYEPLMRAGEPVGVLVVGWPAAIRASGSRATVVALLAHEAAGAIDRADTLVHLTDMASTDPLTGLPNRRAWDARINQALSVGQQFTIAMLDFDHFKEFNDTYGHPAGDRLLKETAAMWREQLRSGDLLARLGGEEFGLLLVDCDSTRVVEVIERLRKLIYRNRTCSAGFAARQPGESADAVIARADAALYEAKASGRDRVCMSAT